jgi:hypothetical protein
VVRSRRGTAVDAYLAHLDADPVRVRQLGGWTGLPTALASLPTHDHKAA